MNEQDLHDAVGKLPKRIEPPRDLWPDIEARINRRSSLRRRWYWIPLAAAAVLAGVWLVRSQPVSWDLAVVSGRPLVGTKPLTGTGRLRVGETVQTDDSSRALLAVGRIGQVEVLPGTRVQLVAARPDEHRLALGLRVQRDQPNRLATLLVELAYRVDEPHGRLTAVHDRQAPERSLHRRGPQPRPIAVRIGASASASTTRRSTLTSSPGTTA